MDIQTETKQLKPKPQLQNMLDLLTPSINASLQNKESSFKLLSYQRPEGKENNFIFNIRGKTMSYQVEMKQMPKTNNQSKVKILRINELREI